MRKIATYLIIVLSIVACSAVKKSTKTTPVNAIVFNTDCDSLIKAALSKIKSDSCNRIDLQIEVIRLTQALSDCYKHESECSEALASKETVFVDKSKTKIKNSFNDVTKNSNNTTEINNLKRSIQVKSDSIAYLQSENLALNGKVKDLIKNKKSTTGENSPNIAKSGNTTQKAAWYLWVIVFIAGGISFQAVRMLITKSI
jgi:hypothetical protein